MGHRLQGIARQRTNIFSTWLEKFFAEKEKLEEKILGPKTNFVGYVW
jgi:hypothetical protein